MIDARNLGVLTCGLVADPEMVGNGKAVKYRLAADMAGNERDSDNRTGYFEAVQFLRDDQHSKFVTSQVNDGKLSKGSQVMVTYRLQQSRWQNNEGQNRSRVELVVESLNYVPRSGGADADAKTNGQTAEAAASVPESF